MFGGSISRARIDAKYTGVARNDFESYLFCRKLIAEGFIPEHYLKLKKHYRRTLLNNPFRKGFGA